MSQLTSQLMMEAARWLLWRYGPANANGKRPKIPCNVRTGRACDNTDPANWATYQEAVAAVQGGEGLGFALGDGWQGIDGDSEEAAAFLRDNAPGYVEESPNGGVHVIGFGPSFPALASNDSGYEAYAGGRYFTFTGNALRDDPMTDLAPFVAQAVAPRHGAGKTAPAAPSARQHADPVDAATMAQLADALTYIDPGHYGTWQPGLAALKSIPKNGGYGLARDWSRRSNYCGDAEFDRKWHHDIRADHTSYRAVFSMAQANGWQNPGYAQDVPHVKNPIAANNPFAGQGVTSSGLIMRPMSEVKMSRVEYLWKGWLPLGYITLAAGETGAAKSTAVADIAAKISNGLPFPGENEGRAPAKVLWLGSEDGVEDMTVPRLTANKANLQNIIEVRGVNRNGARSTFSMQDDIIAVSEILKDGIARNDPFKLIVIDPVTSYLSGTKQREVKINDAGQLRAVLEPWLVVAQEYKIAIICVTHFMKDTNRSMLHRVLGSAAFGETCRSLIAFVDRKTDQQPFAKSMIQVKTNLPEHPGGAWLFETVKVQVGVDEENGKPIFATVPAWDRIDALVDMENSIAKSGAYSDSAVGFAVWITNYFRNLPEDRGVEVAKLKAEAIGQNVITEKNWEKFSPAYLEKRNIGGVWHCRPRARSL